MQQNQSHRSLDLTVGVFKKSRFSVRGQSATCWHEAARNLTRVTVARHVCSAPVKILNSGALM